MTERYNKDKYLEDPEKKDQNDQEDMGEKLIYGDEEPMEEKERKKKEYQNKQLNENK